MTHFYKKKPISNTILKAFTKSKLFRLIKWFDVSYRKYALPLSNSSFKPIIVNFSYHDYGFAWKMIYRKKMVQGVPP